MREIKFRAWIKFLQRIATVTEFYPTTQSMLTDGYDYAIAFDDAHLMQYTGLKDKNGVEIYECDVVKFKSDWDTHICTVLFYGGAFRFGREINGSLGINNDSPLYCFLDGSGCDGYEVIGNIHQNPELLPENSND